MLATSGNALVEVEEAVEEEDALRDEAVAGENAEVFNALLEDGSLQMPPHFGTEFVLAEPRTKAHAKAPTLSAVESDYFIFPSAEHLERAVRERQRGRASCPLCGKGFPNKDLLGVHMKHHRKTRLSSGDEHGVDFHPAVCVVCHERFPKHCPLVSASDGPRHLQQVRSKALHGLIRHYERAHMAGEGWRCDKCGELFRSSGERNLHADFCLKGRDAGKLIFCLDCLRQGITMSFSAKATWKAHQELTLHSSFEVREPESLLDAAPEVAGGDGLPPPHAAPLPTVEPFHPSDDEEEMLEAELLGVDPEWAVEEW